MAQHDNDDEGVMMGLKLSRVFLILSAFVAAHPAWAQTEPKAPPSAAPPAQVVRWINQNMVPLGGPESAASPEEARTLARLARDAKVIAFGEIGHGFREPLQYRNRLIRHLVLHEGLTAVVLESGLAESKGIYDYVLGGPGDAATVVRAGLTHGFGFIPENVELVEWLRQHNRQNPRRPVRFYGIDFSSVQSAPPGVRGFGSILQQLDTYLLRTIPAESSAVRAALKPFALRFNEVDYAGWSAAERGQAAGALQQLNHLFVRHRAKMVLASSPDEHGWASRLAYDARQLPAAFAAWMIVPQPLDDPVQLESLVALLNLRDAAMADHTRWVAQREGAKGKVLLFQTNGHISADTMTGSVMRWFKRQPKLTGILLRQALGQRYRAIASVSSRGRPASDSSLGSVDRAFAAAGRSPVMVDLTAPGRPAWWAQPQSFSQGDARVDDFVPARAFDAMIYFDRLTALPPPPMPPQPR